MSQLLRRNYGIVGAGAEWHGTCMRGKFRGISDYVEVGVIFVNIVTPVMVWSWSQVPTVDSS